MNRRENSSFYQEQPRDVGSEIAEFRLFILNERLRDFIIREGETIEGPDYLIQVRASQLYLNGRILERGQQLVEGDLLLVLNNDTDIYTRYIVPPTGEFLVSQEKGSGLLVSTAAQVLYKDQTALVSPNGDSLYINSRRISQDRTTDFQPGDSILLGRLLIECLEDQWQITGLFDEPQFSPENVLLEDKNEIYQADFPFYSRSPRISPTIFDERQRIEKPSAPPTKPRNAIWRAIIPPVGMIALSALVTMLMRRNAVMMLTMGGMSVLTATFSITSYFSDKKDYQQKKLDRVEDYQLYLLGQLSILNQHYKEEKEILTYRQPSVTDLIQMIVRYDNRIYERLPSNEDFMDISIGIGDVASKLQIDYQMDYLTKDEITIFAQDLLKKFEKQEQVPLVTKLLGNIVGLVAPPALGQGMVQQFLLQLAAFHSYHDVIFVMVTSYEDYQNVWKKWRFLPHFHLPSVNVRSFVYDDRTKDAVLTGIYQMLQYRFQEKAGKDKLYLPQIVLVVTDDRLLSGHVINESLARPDLVDYGVTVIWMKESRRQLPETVTSLIQLKNHNSGILINNQGTYANQDFIPYPAPQDYEKAIRALSNLHHEEVEKNALPKSITFLEMYGVEEVGELEIERRWLQGDTSKSLAVPLGVRGRDDRIYLNLHERAHGPHGLIAGTTGSGKSELLQSYILSLALNFSPEDIGFLPIDFKGGGMANLFKNLPHLMGVITNLDGAGTQRALASIRAELQKRQRLFGQFGVNHINGYTKLYKEGKAGKEGVYPTEPLPHLFLISDEFAELKQNEPEFMTELVSTARIGRSLGIHLILATQKPSGVVNDQIWSNSRFKLALKVADAADSNEIIKTPDAASITEPGRAYLQVGNNEIYELFQSAWSGASYSPLTKAESEELDTRLWLINDLGQYEIATENLSFMDERKEQPDETELAAVVDYINQYAKRADVTLPSKPWLPPLKEKLVSPLLDERWKSAKQYQVPLALMDLPSEQDQRTLYFDIEEFGHSIFYASPGFGKSQTLQTLVMNFARLNRPDQLQINLFDFGTNGLSPLKDLPHVADITTLDNEEKLLKYLNRVKRDLQSRRDLFAEHGVSTLAQYEQKTGESLPLILNIVDTYDTVRDHALEGFVEPVFHQVLREGAGLGVYLIATVLRNTTMKLSMRSNFATQFVLYLADKDSKKELIGFDSLEDQAIPGRGQIRLESPLRFQVYLAVPGDSDLERLQNLDRCVQELSQKWQGPRPAPIPMLAKEISFADFEADRSVQDEREELKIPIGYDKETTQLQSLEPMNYEFILLMDDSPTQTDSLEQSILQAFAAFSGRADRIVVDADNRFAAEETCFDTIVNESDVGSFFSELLGLIQSGMARTKPMFIYLPDINLTGDRITLSDKDINRIFTKAAAVNIHLIFHGYQSGIETKFTPFFKRLRQNVPMGTFGTIFNEQKVVPGRGQFNEPLVGIDELQFFIGRSVSRVKLPQN